MADDWTVLTDERKSQIVKWLSEKAGEQAKPCTVCGQIKWRLGDYLVAPPIYAGKGLRLGGNAYPFALLLCQHCGNTQFINAVVMGLFPPGIPESGNQND